MKNRIEERDSFFKVTSTQTNNDTGTQSYNITNHKVNNQTGSQVNNSQYQQTDNGNRNQVDNITITQSNNDKSNQMYIRKTYHLTQDIIDSLAIYSVFEDIDKSEIVRNALKEYIPTKYTIMASNKVNNITNKQ